MAGDSELDEANPSADLAIGDHGTVHLDLRLIAQFSLSRNKHSRTWRDRLLARADDFVDIQYDGAVAGNFDFGTRVFPGEDGCA